MWARIQEELAVCGIDLQTLGGGDTDPSCVKIVCLPANLKESVREIGESTRDQVVMVRIDEETRSALDAWVETGAVKSRSEAAALFIREGLTVRKSEREQLSDALRDVEKAKDRLREEARAVLGEQDE